MKQLLISALAVAMLMAGCTKQTSNNINENNNSAAVQEVAGRTNFGAQHALMTTPQLCVMIATWDKDKNPDVMMAAWAGQYDYNQIVI